MFSIFFSLHYRHRSASFAPHVSENRRSWKACTISSFLVEFDFKIQYRPGKCDLPANHLSRIDHGGIVANGFDEVDHYCLTATYDDYAGLDSQLSSIAAYLAVLSINHLSLEERRKSR